MAAVGSGSRRVYIDESATECSICNESYTHKNPGVVLVPKGPVDSLAEPDLKRCGHEVDLACAKKIFAKAEHERCCFICREPLATYVKNRTVDRIVADPQAAVENPVFDPELAAADAGRFAITAASGLLKITVKTVKVAGCVLVELFRFANWCVEWMNKEDAEDPQQQPVPALSPAELQDAIRRLFRGSEPLHNIPHPRFEREF